jgi:NAD(P)-dependent dehydrogenase (short-subunit alcohol dehydrogenase family)
MRERSAIGATGIGFATAELLVRDGSRVFLTDRDRQSLYAARQQLGVNAAALQFDSSDPEVPGELVQALCEHVMTKLLASRAFFSPMIPALLSARKSRSTEDLS